MGILALWLGLMAFDCLKGGHPDALTYTGLTRMSAVIVRFSKTAFYIMHRFLVKFYPIFGMLAFCTLKNDNLKTISK